MAGKVKVQGDMTKLMMASQGGRRQPAAHRGPPGDHRITHRGAAPNERESARRSSRPSAARSRDRIRVRARRRAPHRRSRSTATAEPLRGRAITRSGRRPERTGASRRRSEPMPASPIGLASEPTVPVVPSPPASDRAGSDVHAHCATRGRTAHARDTAAGSRESASVTGASLLRRPRQLRARAASSATVQRSPLSIFSAVDHDFTRCTTPPCTRNVSPVIGQSAVARYATNGDTFAGSHTSNAPDPRAASPRRQGPGVASA